MSVKIGHASIDERGRAKGGAAGDQTGKEVCVRDWYSKPWKVLLRPKDAGVAERMAAACEAGCANGNIGYDQNQRNTLHTLAKANGYDLAAVGKCETDCSAFMTVCAIAAGVTALEYTGNAPTTSTMRAKFTATGAFSALTASKYLTGTAYLKRGDILLAPGSHTAMVLGTDTSAVAPSGGAKLTVDGRLGMPDVAALQRWLGTEVDGIISGQSAKYKKSWPTVTDNACKWTGGKSPMVKALQRRIGVGSPDCVLGPATARAMQTFLIRQGFSCGASGVDGIFGAASTQALQLWLNSL